MITSHAHKAETLKNTFKKNDNQRQRRRRRSREYTKNCKKQSKYHQQRKGI